MLADVAGDGGGERMSDDGRRLTIVLRLRPPASLPIAACPVSGPGGYLGHVVLRWWTCFVGLVASGRCAGAGQRTSCRRRRRGCHRAGGWSGRLAVRDRTRPCRGRTPLHDDDDYSSLTASVVLSGGSRLTSPEGVRNLDADDRWEGRNLLPLHELSCAGSPARRVASDATIIASPHSRSNGTRR